MIQSIKKLSCSLAVASVTSISVLGMAMPALTTPAQAGQTKQQGSAQFVRMGLNKSIVVRLPADARDVLIGNPEVVDAVIRTQNTAYLFAKKPGQTNAFFFDAYGRQILNLDIEVSQDMKSLKKLIDRTIPGNKIKVDSVGESIVLSGTAKSSSEAKTAMDLALKYVGNDASKAMSTIGIAGREQVTLKVRVTEMQREVVKNFGINLDKLATKAGNFAVGGAIDNPFVNTISDSFLATQYASGNTQIDATLRAMERDGLLRTLAEPTLTAISGENAKFLAGGEFPITVSSANTNGVNNISVEFKPFGVGLGFTPVVLNGGRISLQVNTEVSEVTTENGVNLGSVVVPALKVRRASTTVELPSGGSMVMAGLIQESTKQSMTGIPGAKNLPVLGALFRSRDYQSNQTEMVVIVTPYIVQPVSEKELNTPGEFLNEATDAQAILFGQLHKLYGTAGEHPKGKYHGNVGFIVE